MDQNPLACYNQGRNYWGYEWYHFPRKFENPTGRAISLGCFEATKGYIHTLTHKHIHTGCTRHVAPK